MADALEQRLAQRAAPEELERRGILKQGGVHASARTNLERSLAKDVVGRRIEQRPALDNLVQANIAVDTSLAPSLHGPARALDRQRRADQLRAALAHRQAPDQVKSVLPADDVAPRLRQARIALENAFTRDHLKHMLGSRPSPDDLVRANILKAPSSVAPALQATQQALEKQILADKLNDFIGTRQAPAADEQAAASIQAVQRDLKRSIAKSNLYHALQSRPTALELQQRGILDDDYDEACLSTNATASAGPGPGDDAVGQFMPARHDSAFDDPLDTRARSFLLTRTLLQAAAALYDAGEISQAQKGALKDLIVDQDPSILAAADLFDADGDVHDFKDTLVRLSFRR